MNFIENSQVKAFFIYYSAVVDVARLATINRIANVHSTVPALTQDDSDVVYCNAEKLPKESDIGLDKQPVYLCTHQIELQLGKVYDIVLIDMTSVPDNASHPFHLHGHVFQVISMGNKDQLKHDEYVKSAHPPIIKDTVTLPKGGFVKIRFRATNPGYWVCHCTIFILIFMNTAFLTLFVYSVAFPLSFRISYESRYGDYIESGQS